MNTWQSGTHAVGTWRYTANFWTAGARGGIAKVTRPYPCPASAEGDAIDGLQAFYDGQRQEHGDNLRWVELERSDYGPESFEHEDGWVLVTRLQP